MTNTITIAHLSDLHLTEGDDDKRYGSSLRGMNRNLAVLLNCSAVKDADVVLVSGDITDRGRLVCWERFWSMTAHMDPDKLLVVPGNHDICCLGLRRRRSVAEHLAIARAGLTLGHQPMNFPWVKLCCGGELAVFAVDSVNAGNFNVADNAVGVIGADQLVKLGKLLRVHATVPCKLIVLHHSPNIPGRATSKRRGDAPMPFWLRPAMQLRERDRATLRTLARVFDVKALLHGHTHENQDRRVGGVRIIGAKDSTAATDADHLSFKLHRYELSSRRLKSQVIRIRADSQG